MNTHHKKVTCKHTSFLTHKSLGLEDTFEVKLLSQEYNKVLERKKKSYLAEQSAAIIVGLITLFLISYDYH